MTLLGQETLTVTPYTGSWDGDYTATPAATFTVDGSVQPLAPGEDVEGLDEGDRIRARAWLLVEDGQTEISPTDLAAQTPSDRVAWQGKDYEVMSRADWTPHSTGLPHKVFLLLLVGEDE